jgi:RNA polymerase sigma-70 factor (ECF subfamily)
LVAGLTRRERDPMATIYERYAGTVFDFARCTLVQRSLAEDVVQEVFLELWNRPERFDPVRGSLRAYLLTLAHARSVDAVRSESARRRREDRDGLRAVTTSEADEDRQADADQVRSALAALSVDQREAISLAYFLGCTYRDVAARLGVPEGTIKNRIRKGLERLRVELAGTEAAS